MKFLIDADSPYSLIKIFNKYGHEAVHVRDILKFSTDDKIFEYANKNKYIIVTKDLGFAKMFIDGGGLGLVLIRLPYYFKTDMISNSFDEFLKEVKTSELVNSITVLELKRYRVKKIS